MVSFYLTLYFVNRVDYNARIKNTVPEPIVILGTLEIDFPKIIQLKLVRDQQHKQVPNRHDQYRQVPNRRHVQPRQQLQRERLQ